MLVLSRKSGERIHLGDDITIVVNKISGNRVSIGIDAPADVQIVRGELPRIPNPRTVSGQALELVKDLP